MELAEFRPMYEAHFGPLPNAEEHARYWATFLRGVPGHRGEELCGRMEAFALRNSKPRIAAARRALADMLGTSAPAKPGQACGYCRGQGAFRVIIHRDGEKWRLGDGPGQNAATCVPCVCTLGIKYAKPGNEDMSRRAKQWRDGLAAELEHGDESTSPENIDRYLDHILREKRAGAPAPKPEPPAESPAPETVAAVIAEQGDDEPDIDPEWIPF